MNGFLQSRPESQRAVVDMKGRERRLAGLKEGRALIERTRAIVSIENPHVALVVFGIAGGVLGADGFHAHHRVTFPRHPVAIVPEARIADLLFFRHDREWIADPQGLAWVAWAELNV